MNFIGEYNIDEKVCSDVLEYYHSSDDKIKIRAKSLWRDVNSDQWISEENPKIKQSTEIGINVSGIADYFHQGAQPVNKVIEKYLDQLQICLDKYAEEYSYCNKGSAYTITEPMNIQHYKPGEGYHEWHTERNGSVFPQVARHLVFMTYLNTVTDKGGTEFYYQKLTTDAVVGKTLIWPSDWTHTHRGIPSPTQEKTIVTGWFSYFQ